MRIVRVALLTLGASVLLAVGGCGATATLRSTDVQEAISTGLADQVGGEFRVTCPTGIAAQQGASFTCAVTDVGDGSTLEVTVLQTDDAGAFDWRVAPLRPTAAPQPS